MYISTIGSYRTPETSNKIINKQSASQVDDKKVSVENKAFSNPIVTADTFLSQISFGARPKYPTIDSFTGLRDKKCLFTDLDNLMNKKIENNEDISVAMFDMDNFKSVNELLGYKTGDEFIKSISGSVAKIAKENNLNAYRFGGDEFVIIFDEQSDEEQTQIVEEILQITNDDDVFKSKNEEYLHNADERLERLGSSNAKIHELFDLKAKKSILEDLRENLTTDAAKNDPYLLVNIASVDSDVKSLYLSLIDESIAKEDDEDIRDNLTEYREKIEKDEEIEPERKNSLDEYLRSKFYKSLEIYQTKKWLHDFEENKGFSVTGGLIRFAPSFYADRMPIDLIDDTGECLKKGKNSKKGRAYYINRN